MSNKRPLVPDIYKHRKKICIPSSNDEDSSVSVSSNEKADVTLDTKGALTILHAMFPTDKFDGRVPSIILKHQLYSIVTNRTQVDKELSELKTKGEVRLFRLGVEADDLCVMFTNEYTRHCQKLNPNKPSIEKFINTVIPQCTDISLTRETLLNQFNFKEEEITDLMKAGLLTLREVGSWWLAIPGAGEFMKSYVRGRKAVLLMIRKCKYGEVLQKELETRKLPKIAKLGMLYHIYDIVGAELVTSLNTTSGRLLRLKGS